LVRAVRYVVRSMVVSCAVLAVRVVATPAQADPVVRDVDGGNVRVSVDRNFGFGPGDPVKIVLEGLNGTTLNMVSVNQCLKDPINHWEFAADGGYCAEAPLSEGHDAQKEEGPLGPGIRHVEITYRIGTGVQRVDDMFGTQRELGCQQGRLCFLSLYIQETNDPDVQLSFPISFGSDPPPPAPSGDQGGAEPGRADGAGGTAAPVNGPSGDAAAASGQVADAGNGAETAASGPAGSGSAAPALSGLADGPTRTAGTLLALVLVVALVFWGGVWFARRGAQA
jgi:hypothetical protein